MSLTKVSNALLAGYPFAGGGGGVTPTLSVSTRTALKALDTTITTQILLTEVGREGTWVWRTGDYAARITADSREGLYIKANAIASTAGAWVRLYTGIANVTWWGTVGDGVADDTAALQAASDLVLTIRIPEPSVEYKITTTWTFRDYAVWIFDNQKTIIKNTTSNSTISSKNKTGQRTFFFTLISGRLDGGSRSNGAIALDFLSTTDAHVWGTFIYNHNIGVKNGGAGSQSAYYNTFNSVVITSCNSGIQNGTLGNEVKCYQCRITDVLIGTEDDNNTGTVYDGCAIETFTLYGSRLSNSGFATVFVRITNGRYENPSTGGAYASAIAIRVNPASQSTRIRDNYISVVATGLSDSGVNTGASGN